jgi:hypothetical protein
MIQNLGFKTLKILICLISTFLLFSCGKSEEKILQTKESQKASLYKIELFPKGATKNSIISVRVKGANPSDLSYQWLVNGVEIKGVTGSILNYPGLKKKDKVQVKVTIKGKDELISPPLIISNIIPRIQSAKLVPQNPKKGDDIKVEVITFDEDADYVSLSYEWFINGKPFNETSNILKNASLKRGDKVSVKITPTDGEQKGQPVILYCIITNSPPIISEDIEAKFDGLTYTTKISAMDPDGDAIIYTLKQGPQGMTINPTTGILTWKVSPTDEGEHDVIVSVSDNNGGEVLVPFTATIRFGETP